MRQFDKILFILFICCIDFEFSRPAICTLESQGKSHSSLAKVLEFSHSLPRISGKFYTRIGTSIIIYKTRTGTYESLWDSFQWPCKFAESSMKQSTQTKEATLGHAKLGCCLSQKQPQNHPHPLKQILKLLRLFILTLLYNVKSIFIAHSSSSALSSLHKAQSL